MMGRMEVSSEVGHIIESLKAAAIASNLTLEEYLQRLIENSELLHSESHTFTADINGTENLSLAEIDQILDQLSEGTEQITFLPPHFSCSHLDVSLALSLNCPPILPIYFPSRIYACL